MIFRFVVNYLGFLKSIPFFGLIYDSLIKIWLCISNPQMLSWFDEIEEEVLNWDGTSISLHRFGGTQFNYQRKELGHLHSNGILDIRFSLQIKKALIADGIAREHHMFAKSGWVSLYIKNQTDVENALSLLSLAYSRRQKLQIISIDK